MKKILIILILILSVFSVANAHPFKSEKELYEYYAEIDKKIFTEKNKPIIRKKYPRKLTDKELEQEQIPFSLKRYTVDEIVGNNKLVYNAFNYQLMSISQINENNKEEPVEEEEENEDEMQKYSESVKEILDNGKNTLKEQKDEIDKYQRIIDYFKIGKNQKEFGIPDDYVRGFKLKIAEVKIAKNMMNYGIESAVKYYLENVSTKDVTYEDVYFNEQSELALYLAVAQMLSVADENVLSKYRKEFENTRVIKLLDEILKNERKKEKERDGKTQDKNHIKS